MEIWKDIIGYEGLYQISDLGQVKSLPKFLIRGKNGEGFWRGEQFMQHHFGNTGYININLTKNGKMNRFLLHSLIAIHFIPNPNNYGYVDHINENKLDFSISNLRWCTNQQNNIFSFENGRKAASGAKAARSIKVLCTETNRIFDCAAEAEKVYGIGYNQLARKLNGLRTNNTSLVWLKESK